jgi:hypothetical protein
MPQVLLFVARLPAERVRQVGRAQIPRAASDFAVCVFCEHDRDWAQLMSHFL